MRLAWATDTHFNFVHEQGFRSFAQKVLNEDPDALVITGDISEAPYLERHLDDLQNLINMPLFFVCGNHDFYHGSIDETREKLQQRYTYDPYLDLEPQTAWLGCSPVVQLTEKTALVGADGWYDALYADFFKSRLEMSDWMVIRELVQLYHIKEELVNKFRRLAAQSAHYVAENLAQAFEDGYEEVFVATHVAPWRENAVFNGKISDHNFMPMFSSKHMGDAIVSVAEDYPNQRVTVLCGHSHGNAFHEPAANVRAFTGKARYKHPKVNDVFVLE